MQIIPVTASQLASALSTHAVELVFKRRIFPPAKTRKYGYPASKTRRMFATNCPALLLSDEGKRVLRYSEARPTAQGSKQLLKKYNPIQEGLVCAFDLFWLEYRMISAESCGIVAMKESEFSKQVLTEIYKELDFETTIEEGVRGDENLKDITVDVTAEPNTIAQQAYDRLIKIKRAQSTLYNLEKSKKRRTVLQLPMPVLTKEDRILFWTYWMYNIQPRSINWKLQFENI